MKAWEYRGIPAEVRFWMRVKKTSGCWLWKGPKQKGYGVLRVGRVYMKATRFSYRLHYGEDPGKLLVCHHCDNPACIRPDHLFLGTPSENQLDALAKGRWKGNPKRGVDNSKSKLNDESVKEIRGADSSVTNKYLAEKFQVDPSTISVVRRGKKWKHLKGKVGEIRGRKLTIAQVQKIRDLAGTATQRSLARKFKVSEATISNIINLKART